MLKKYQYISFLVLFFLTISLAAQKKSRKQLEQDRTRIKKEITMVNKLLFDAKKSEKNALEDLKDLNPILQSCFLYLEMTN